MANPNPPPIELTDEQKAIVETDEDTIVISNPGTGKTTTLSAKVVKLLEDGVKPPNWSAEMEKSLIAEWRGQRGCQNIAPGGENRPGPGVQSFVYLVVADLSSGLSLQQKSKRRSARESGN